MIDEKTAKGWAMQSCDKLFDVVWNFLKYLYSGERLRILLAVTALMWILTIVNVVVGGKLTEFGIAPRDFPFGFLGIFFAPLIHSSIGHVAANTISFILLGALVMLRGIKVWAIMSVLIAISSGFLVWVLAASGSHHVGASSMIFGYFGYLVIVACIERHWKSVLIALVVGFLYGGMIFGIFPGANDKVSWEGHFSGMLMGGLCGYFHMVVFGGMVIERPDLPYEYNPVNTKDSDSL